LIKAAPTLFNSGKDEIAEKLAQHYYLELKTKKKIDRVSGIPTDFDLINLKTLTWTSQNQTGLKSW